MRWEYEDRISFNVTPDLLTGSQVVDGVRMYLVNDDGSPVYGVCNCSRCQRPFIPMGERTVCVSCLRQQRADARLQEMAFARESMERLREVAGDDVAEQVRLGLMDFPRHPKVENTVIYRCPRCNVILNDYEDAWVKRKEHYKCACGQAISDNTY